MTNKLAKNPKLKNFSKHLRKNATKEENKLWYGFLRANKVKFHRQIIIGNYIADFFCPKAKLVIEIDGSQHYSKTGLNNDALRTEYFNSLGIEVLRFNNKEINQQFSAVFASIQNKVQQSVEITSGK